MQQITSEKFDALLNQSSLKSKIKNDLRFNPTKINDWHEREFLAIFDKTGNKGILLVQVNNLPLKIIPFTLRKRIVDTNTGRTKSIICDFCKTWQTGARAGRITFGTRDNSTTYICCSDLNCSDHIRGKTKESKMSKTQLREDITIDQKIARLTKNIQQLVSEYAV